MHFNLIDVRADGHCGFRAVSHFVYGTEDRWCNVRRDLLGEIQKNRKLYDGMGLDLVDLSKRISRLDPGFASEAYWFSSHECSILTATCYGRPVVFLTNKIVQQAIYLPILSPFSPSAAAKTIFLFLDHSHFNVALPRDFACIKYPPIDPQTRYQAKIHESCATWHNFFTNLNNN